MASNPFDPLIDKVPEISSANIFNKLKPVVASFSLVFVNPQPLSLYLN